MLKSMTGYGAYRIQDETCVQEWEIKSVNGKQLGVRWRLPPFLRSCEPTWERIVRQTAERGRIDVSLQVNFLQPDFMPVHLDHGQALAMLRELSALAERQGHGWGPDYSRLLNVSSLWQESSLSDQDAQGERFRQGLDRVLEEWDAFRQNEGQALARDLAKRVQQLGQWVEELGGQTSGLAEERYQVLRERISRLLTLEEAEVDEQRMLQELAILADKLDVSEEITRLTTHIQVLAEYLHMQKAGGRKLDFLLQECFREINTLGNKAQNTEVSQVVVDFKAELEKCREQVQNLE
ncbi:MAG: YicC/YloC family endoribonuclease [Desulfovermiculus sp.]|nr:YicC/YloC family endoribonuclease [Desulfovermiculus sp.]